MLPVAINLDRSFFFHREKVFAEHSKLKASLFLYDSGVQGLRIENELGHIIALPYQGQQIWDCCFLGRNLTMKSMFTDPVPNVGYLQSYGAFLLHCGATAMGVPSKTDTHPLHGELPNAVYERAWLEIGEDEKGKYISLRGQYRHCIAFNINYTATPSIKVYENSSIIDVSMSIKNNRKTDMDLMYMMHINFKPVDHSEILYTADYTPEKVMVHADLPAHMQSDSDSSKLIKYLNDLKTKPELHHVVDPGLPYDPEVVLIIKYNEDENGNAHSMQLHPDGYASYVSHRPSELKYGVRWIARTKDEDAMGLVLPATAGHRGYTTEKELGNLEILPAGEIVEYHVKTGILNPSESEEMKKKILTLNNK
ncbi:MAG: DUF4432 family protein [Caldicoprobacterales bacterium]|jgi:hypothetical protein|nr:DUF4432 family protein [Clostridiales bacterium]